MLRPLITFPAFNHPQIAAARPGPGSVRKAQPTPPRPSTPGVPAPPGARPGHCSRGATQRPASASPSSRRGAATHLRGAPGGAGSRRGGAAAAGGAPGPSHPGRPHHWTGRRRGAAGAGVRQAASRPRRALLRPRLSPPPALAAPSFRGSNPHVPPFPAPGLLLSPSSPPHLLPQSRVRPGLEGRECTDWQSPLNQAEPLSQGIELGRNLEEDQGILGDGDQQSRKR